MVTTVSIIEDDFKFALLLKRIIETDESIICIDIFQNIKNSLTKLAENPPDIILLDIQLTDVISIGYIDILKKICENTHIIMCTSFENDEYIFEALKNGASGYILKSDSPEQIANALQEVVKGGAPMSNSIARKVVNYFTTEKKNLNDLTRKENELLMFLADGLLYKEIAIKMNITLDTVKKHASTIYKKLQVCNRTEAINKYNSI